MFCLVKLFLCWFMFVCRFAEKNILWLTVVRRNCAHHAHGISPGAVTSHSFTCNFVEEFCFLKT